MLRLSGRTLKTIKAAVFLACALPFDRLLVRGSLDALGPDPIADLTHTTGVWTLRLLLITLAVTPLRRLTGWQWLAGLRRIVALYAFFYACLHFLIYLIFEQFFDWVAIAKDIVKRPYITAGLLGFTLMIPLAITSTDAMLRRLGRRRWQLLHRLVYVSAAAGVFHYFWLVKRDISLPALYALLLLALLALRMIEDRGKQTRTRRRHSGPGHRAQ